MPIVFKVVSSMRILGSSQILTSFVIRAQTSVNMHLLSTTDLYPRRQAGPEFRKSFAGSPRVSAELGSHLQPLAG